MQMFKGFSIQNYICSHAEAIISSLDILRSFTVNENFPNVFLIITDIRFFSRSCFRYSCTQCFQKIYPWFSIFTVEVTDIFQQLHFIFYFSINIIVLSDSKGCLLALQYYWFNSSLPFIIYRIFSYVLNSLVVSIRSR